MNKLLTVSLRNNAVYIPDNKFKKGVSAITPNTAKLVSNLVKMGYGVSGELYTALNGAAPAFTQALLAHITEVMGMNKNWTPLVKGWDTPTGESVIDHLITLMTNIFKGPGTPLPCGHVIPAGTFPLERYNGCPFCGTPFEFGEIKYKGQGSRLKILELWTDKGITAHYVNLLKSKTALDATQMDSLKILLAELPLPDAQIGMKETVVAVVDFYVENQQPDKAQHLFKSPADILRYLWYKHTGFLQIVEPGVIVKRKIRNNRHRWSSWSFSGKYASVKDEAVNALKLKYSRKTGVVVAKWLNDLTMDAQSMCEAMHPKRGLWVRMIRALRLSEFAGRAGFDNLRTTLDMFYNEDYPVWQGLVNKARLRKDAKSTFALLEQRPGLFARSLFANMLWFGYESTVEAFARIIDKVPARLVFTLNMYAENYFSPENRTVKPLGGVNRSVAPNKLIQAYGADELAEMKNAVTDLCILAVKKRFASMQNANKTIYIDPALFSIPVAIGDRSESVQDMPSALMGTRFEVEGDKVRLFMQWGTGLPAQHLDMDLSCAVAYPTKTEQCSFSDLVITGCKHSGDIRHIPDEVGTAEYIDLDLAQLKKAKAQYVTFTCNAYSAGSLSPNMVVGWMNSRFPMRISETTGVAYDPSCVQHQVRITSGLTKGLVFGVLDVAKSEIIWLEMPFGGQTIRGLDVNGVKDMLRKLEGKLTIGNLLKIKAEAQNLAIVDEPQADEMYTRQWAQDAAAVTSLLVD